MVMVVTKRDEQVLQLGKEEIEKQKPSVIKTKVSNRFCFGDQDTVESVITFWIDSCTIKRENLWLSGYRVPPSEVIHVYAFRDLVH